MVKVVIADDEEFVRYFLKTIMARLSFKVVGEVENGDELPTLMEDTRPDILFLDINMPKLTGIEFLEQYAPKFPHTCIIILTSMSLMDLVDIPSLANVHCFLRKNTPVEEMVTSITQAWAKFHKEKKSI